MNQLQQRFADFVPTPPVPMGDGDWSDDPAIVNPAGICAGCRDATPDGQQEGHGGRHVALTDRQFDTAPAAAFVYSSSNGSRLGRSKSEFECERRVAPSANSTGP
jgi:hypothetical protein